MPRGGRSSSNKRTSWSACDDAPTDRMPTSRGMRRLRLGSPNWRPPNADRRLPSAMPPQGSPLRSRNASRSLRPVEGSRSASTSVPQPVGGAFAEHERAGTSVIEQDPAKGSTADSDAINRAPAVPWWRRRRSLIVGGAIATLALNVAVTASMSQLLADESTPIPAETATAEVPPVPAGQGGGSYVPAPDHVLALRSDGAAADQPHDPGGKLDALGISPGELKRYEDFHGPEA